MRIARCLLLAALAACRPAKPEIGRAAPELELPALLQAPQASFAGLKSLRGKAVVLEFWATWCDPCVEQIPHLNNLYERFASRPIVFISVSDEPRNTVEAFLKDHPIKGWVAADARAAFAAYHIRSRPRTLMIGADGRLAAATYADFVQDADIEALLAGKRVAQGPGGVGDLDEGDGIAPAAKSSAAPLYEARVEKAAGKGSSYMTSDVRFSATGMPPELLLALAYGVPQTRVRLARAPNDSYDAEVDVPPAASAQLMPALQRALTAALALRLSRKTETVDAWALTKAGAGPKSAAKNGRFGYSEGRGRITATGMSMTDLARSLEGELGAPVLDETGLSGGREFELRWQAGKPQTLSAALKAASLSLSKTKRPVELLCFSPAAAKQGKK